jgi:hypothetical protein
MAQLIPVLSLAIALLAVFVGPFVSWLITKRQLESAQRLANKQIVAPMRQAWITTLRKFLAELCSSATHYFETGCRTDADCKRLAELQQEIILMLNPKEGAHNQLLQAIRCMLEALDRGKDHDRKSFVSASMDVTKLAQEIFKEEWNRVKEEI